MLSMCYRLELLMLVIDRYVYMSSEEGHRSRYRSSSFSGRQSSVEMPGLSISMRTSAIDPQSETSHSSPITSHLPGLEPDALRTSTDLERPTPSSPEISLTIPPSAILIELSSSDLESVLSVSCMMFIVLTGMFWSFQTFDMVGDVYGSGTGTLWSVLVGVILCVTSLLYLLCRSRDPDAGPGDAIEKTRSGRTPNCRYPNSDSMLSQIYQKY